MLALHSVQHRLLQWRLNLRLHKVHFVCTWVGVDRGVPNPPLPSPPLHPLPSPSSPASLPLAPTSLPLASHFPPLGIFLPPPSKNNLSFQCMVYYQSFNTVGKFVCSSVSLFLEFYNLVNGPVDNIVVRSSRVRGEREKTKEDRIDEKKKCKHSRSLSYYNQKQ